ncbi:hypothetical protein TBLA_0C05090 [Henningerozyma blattae CBS 6284]|uniref:Protein transport protein Sec61 subunit beta n=1 Tax=Henningerozyma blattae (strain ATCC 34711 / CBS 6284 / DSM 70876 / NBRC 10599 / NRRL Y-10934 / UCD 77-7) TaxID=1071380 RepID=I2H1Q3_HENB6|nr:hypothetical protein TBLA_0C05090 [Tetrapisispora blattae CBS 6284]CCH60305.1 hypothetical protein TBLA_0C05090 [Tetrapisispora blattae CBS 6284]
MASTPPGGHKTLQKRKFAQQARDRATKQRPTSSRQAGFGGSSAAVLKIATDDSSTSSLRVDPLVILFMSVGFIFSVIVLHVLAKMAAKSVE